MLSPEYKRHVTRPYDILWSRKTLYREGLTQDSYQCIKSIDYLIHGWHSLHDWVRGLCVKSVTKSKIKPTHPVKGYKRKKGPLNRCICCWRDISPQGTIFLLPKAFPTLRFLFYDYHWQLSYPLWKFLCPGKAIGCCRGFPQSGPAPRIPPWVTMPGPSRNETIFMRRRYKETLPTVNDIGKKSWCLVQEEGTFSKWSPRHSRPTALISHEVAWAMVHRSTWRRTLKTTQKNVKQLYIAR